jgi:hypothetical protein
MVKSEGLCNDTQPPLTSIWSLFTHSTLAIFISPLPLPNVELYLSTWLHDTCWLFLINLEVETLHLISSEHYSHLSWWEGWWAQETSKSMPTAVQLQYNLPCQTRWRGRYQTRMYPGALAINNWIYKSFTHLGKDGMSHKRLIDYTMKRRWKRWLSFTIRTAYHASQQTNKLHGLSPQENYADRATAACQRSCCQLFQVQGVAWSAQRIPTTVFSVF